MQQPKVLTAPSPRKGMPDPKLDEAEFKQRFLSQFTDPGFDPLSGEARSHCSGGLGRL